MSVGLSSLVGKKACVPFVASVSISFEEMKVEPFVLLSCCLALFPNNVFPCMDNEPPCYPSWIFCCHLLDTQNFEQGEMAVAHWGSCISALGRKMVLVSGNA